MKALPRIYYCLPRIYYCLPRIYYCLMSFRWYLDMCYSFLLRLSEYKCSWQWHTFSWWWNQSISTVVMFYLTLNYQFSYNCDDVKQSIPAQEETLTNYISGIQECTSSDCTPVCAIGCFDFSLPTDDENKVCNCLHCCSWKCVSSSARDRHGLTRMVIFCI